MTDQIYSYVVWLPNGGQEPLKTNSLKEALDQFRDWVVMSYDHVTVSQCFADGTFTHVACWIEKGVDIP